jgi:hypothetical protein
MGNLQNSVGDLVVGGGQAADEVLVMKLLEGWQCRGWRDPVSYLDQGIPSLPKIGIGDNAYSLAELGLDVVRGGNHQAEQLLL